MLTICNWGSEKSNINMQTQVHVNILIPVNSLVEVEIGQATDGQKDRTQEPEK